MRIPAGPMFVRLIVLDLPHEAGDVNARDREALHDVERRGVYVALASARPLADLQATQRDLGLHGPLIAERGATALEIGGGVVLDERIPPDLTRQILGQATDAHEMVFMRVDGRTYGLGRSDGGSVGSSPTRGPRSSTLRAVQGSLGGHRSETLAIVEAEDAHALFEEAIFRVARRDADDRVIASATWHADVPDDIAGTIERFVAHPAARS